MGAHRRPRRKAASLQCARQDTAGRGSHSRRTQWLLLFVSWLTVLKVEVLYLLFVYLFASFPQKCYINGLWGSGVRQVEGKK